VGDGDDGVADAVPGAVEEVHCWMMSCGELAAVGDEVAA
jgi:hypothetical protein